LTTGLKQLVHQHFLLSPFSRRQFIERRDSQEENKKSKLEHGRDKKKPVVKRKNVSGKKKIWRFVTANPSSRHEYSTSLYAPLSIDCAHCTYYLFSLLLRLLLRYVSNRREWTMKRATQK
jgi:hypothetical protein